MFAQRFWVGGTGNWDKNTTTHWSATSGGSNGASAPVSTDDVIFDSNSGTGTITVNNTTDNQNQCKSLTTTGYAGTVAGGIILVINGNCTIGIATTWTFTADLYMNAAGGVLITNGRTFQGRLGINGGGGTVTLGDNFASVSSIFTQGSTVSFDAAGFNVTCTFFNAASGAATVSMGSGTWNIIGIDGSGFVWNVSSVTTLVPSTSLLKFTDNTNTAVSFAGNGNTYNNVWFNRGASTGQINITDANTYNDFRDNDGIGTHTLAFAHGVTQHFTTFSVNGGSGHILTITSDTTATHTLSAASGQIICFYINLQHSVATGGAVWRYDKTTSTNNQAVSSAGSGWLYTVFSNIVDTVIDTDAVKFGYSVTVKDTIVDTDAINVISGKSWNYPTKPAKSWTDAAK